MHWYADNSELRGIRDTEIPDILLFGGIAVPPSCATDIRRSVEAVKARYGAARAPVKWNFKDLRATYKAVNMEATFERLLQTSKEWRREIFNVLGQFDCTIILSCVQSHSIQRKVIKGVKQDLVRYSFSNGLMRVALHAVDVKPERYQLVLDWPEGADSSPFDSEYASAYNFGQTADKAVTYHSGPLERLCFADSLAFSNMRHTTMLQVADLVVGATRELLECAIGKKETGFGLDLCKMVAPKFREYEANSIFGRGISVASGDSEFRTRIRSYIAQELHGS